MLQNHGLVADTFHLVQIMRYKKHRHTGIHHIDQLLLALLTEFRIADRQHFIQDQNIRTHHGRNRESKSRLHTGGIVLQRNIYKLAKLGELHDLIEFFFHEFARMSKHRSIEENIFRPGILHVEAGTKLNHRCKHPLFLNRSLCRFEYTCNHLHQG